ASLRLWPTKLPALYRGKSGRLGASGGNGENARDLETGRTLRRGRSARQSSGTFKTGHTIQGPVAPDGPSHHVIAGHKTHPGVAAVLGVVAVIAHHKVVILRHAGRTKTSVDRVAGVALLQGLAVEDDHAVADFHHIPRDPDEPLDEVLAGIGWVPEDHDVAPLGLGKPA